MFGLKVYKINDEADPSQPLQLPSEKTLIGTLPYVGTNTAVNKTVKEKQIVYEKAKGFIKKQITTKKQKKASGVNMKFQIKNK